MKNIIKSTTNVIKIISILKKYNIYSKEAVMINIL